jgi:hypothetical protein
MRSRIEAAYSKLDDEHRAVGMYIGGAALRAIVVRFFKHKKHATLNREAVGLRPPSVQQ